MDHQNLSPSLSPLDVTKSQLGHSEKHVHTEYLLILQINSIVFPCFSVCISLVLIKVKILLGRDNSYHLCTTDSSLVLWFAIRHINSNTNFFIEMNNRIFYYVILFPINC